MVEKKMTVEEINNEIERLERAQFFIYMKDYWNGDDGIHFRELGEKIRKLKNLLKTLDK